MVLDAGFEPAAIVLSLEVFCESVQQAVQYMLETSP